MDPSVQDNNYCQDLKGTEGTKPYSASNTETCSNKLPENGSLTAGTSLFVLKLYLEYCITYYGTFVHLGHNFQI